MAEVFPDRKCERAGCTARGDAVTMYHGRQVCRVDMAVWFSKEHDEEAGRLAAFLVVPVQPESMRKRQP